MMQTATFVLGDDGINYLYQGSQIVASSPNLDELEKLAQDFGGSSFGQPDIGMTDPMSQAAPCPCGKPGCPGCGQANAGPAPMNPSLPPITGKDRDRKEERGEEDKERVETDDIMPIEKATHIITPNGVRGKIVGRAMGIYGEEVTVRLENGRIAKYDLVGGEKFHLEDANASKVSAYRELRSKLDEVPAITKGALLKRIEDLREVRKQARALIAGAPYLDAEELDDIIVTAGHEIKEAAQAIEYIDEQGYEAPRPFTHQAVEQGSVGGGDASWLSDVMAVALGEAEATDYDQLMDEAPETLIAEIETPVLSDQEAVHNIADEFVTSKTVGLESNAVQAFRQAFLARVEEVRVRESSARPNRERQVQAGKTQKTAKRLADEASQVPDEGLFL